MLNARQRVPAERAAIALALGLSAYLLSTSAVQAQATLYWDTNSVAAGAGTSPSGTWNTGNSSSARKWSTNSAGTSSSTGWASGNYAVFSAGSDATGAYTVTVSGTQNVASISVEDGTPTITGGTLNFSNADAYIDVAAGHTATVSTVLSGASSTFSKTGGGTLVLSGANTFSGAANINAGTLQLGASNALPNSSAISIASGATLDLGSFSDTVGALSGAGTLQIGSGTLTLGSGMDFSSGSMVLSGGRLNLSGFNSAIGSLSVTANSILDFGTAGGSTLDILNSLTISSGVTLTIANWTDTVDYFLAQNNPGASNLGQIIFAGYTATDTKWQSWDHQITPVPEPAIYGALLLASATLWGGFLRRRRREA